MMVASGNLFAGIPSSIPEELFEILAAAGGCRIERIVSKGHVTPAGEWYDQTWDEWVALLQGEASLLFEGDDEPLHLSPGDWVLIPAHRRHRVIATSTSGEAIWLAVHYSSP